MKNLFVLVLLFWGVNLYSQKIDTLKVYYIPWKTTSGAGPISEAEVRNYQTHKNYFIEFSQDSVIDNFLKTLIVFNVDCRNTSFKPDVRMVLDFISDNSQVYTILIDYNKYMWYNDNPYRINWELMKVIEKYVPEKLVLKGVYYEMKVKKGTLTEKEIKDWQSKGITIIIQDN